MTSKLTAWMNEVKGETRFFPANTLKRFRELARIAKDLETRLLATERELDRVRQGNLTEEPKLIPGPYTQPSPPARVTKRERILLMIQGNQIGSREWELAKKFGGFRTDDEMILFCHPTEASEEPKDPGV